jgi:hypothetical protein
MRWIVAIAVGASMVHLSSADGAVIEVGPGESIQAAIDGAASGDIVVVAPGRYVERLDLLGKAITLRSAGGADETILDGAGLSGSIIQCVSGESQSTLIEGFTITNGHATFGGGILIDAANPIIAHCVLVANTADARGGAMRITGGGASFVYSCAFRENLADYGAAVSNEESSPWFFFCDFSRNGTNDTEGGGAMHNATATPTIYGCTFNENKARDDGCSIYNKFCDAFSIRNCTFAFNVGRGDGGAIYCWDSDPLIDACTFAGNVVRNDSYNDGGAIVIKSFSSPVVSNCLFVDNRVEDGTFSGALNRGGAIFIRARSTPLITDCIFTGNLGDWGGAIGIQDSEPVITRCILDGNEAMDQGGGIFSSYASTPLVEQCTFIDNSALVAGGGLSSYVESSTIVDRCRFIGNHALSGGGLNAVDDVEGGSAPIVTNTLFAGNTANYGGGAMSVERSALTIHNCTLTDNEALVAGAVRCVTDSATLRNTIVWRNTSAAGGGSLGGIGVPTVSYCNIEGGYPGEGNIDADPKFVDDDGADGDPATQADNDYHLAAGSPCIDAGDDAVTDPWPTDIDGQPRVSNGVVDIGADEFQLHCAGDVNGDGLVNFFDALAILAVWGKDGGPEDIDGNGVIGFGDLIVVLAQWGTCLEPQ